MQGITAHLAEIVECIKLEKSVDRSATGTLKVHWVIEPDGHTSHVEVANPAKGRRVFERCMVKVVLGFRFDRGPGPPVPVDFPFKY